MRQRLGQAARERVERHYTDTAIAARTVDYYRQCLARTQLAPRRARGLQAEVESVLGAVVKEVMLPPTSPS